MLVTEFQHTLDALDSVIASRLMQMALTAAKQVLGQAPICDGSLPCWQPDPTAHPAGADVQRQTAAARATRPTISGSKRNSWVPRLSMHGWRLLADNQIHQLAAARSARTTAIWTQPSPRAGMNSAVSRHREIV
jgi:flagellar assembly protein FliH